MPYILPQTPQLPGGAYNAGKITGGIGKLLLGALLGGQIGKVPIGTVSSTRPSGVQGPTLPGGGFVSPANVQSIQDLVNKGVVPPGALPEGMSFNQTGSRFGITAGQDRKLEQQKLAEEARKLRAQADLYEKALKGEIDYQTGPNGEIIPVVPTTTGGRPVSAGKKASSVADLARDQEFNALGGEEQRVQVIAPDGTVGTIPISQLDQALAEGYKQR